MSKIIKTELREHMLERQSIRVEVRKTEKALKLLKRQEAHYRKKKKSREDRLRNINMDKLNTRDKEELKRLERHRRYLRGQRKASQKEHERLVTMREKLTDKQISLINRHKRLEKEKLIMKNLQNESEQKSWTFENDESDLDNDIY